MILTILIGIIVAVCLVSTLIFYMFMRSHESLKSSSAKLSLYDKQQIKYSLRPSFDIITRKLNPDFPFRTSVSSDKSYGSSTTFDGSEETRLTSKKQPKDRQLIKPLTTPIRSSSVVTNLLQARRPRSTNWRQGSIVDSNQMALVQFTLPVNNNDNKYRRRSVAVCNNIIESRENPITMINSTLPCLLSFSIIYLKNSQLKIEFHSLQSLPTNIQLQQLTIKVKLIPDGKEKSIQIRKFIENETTFNDQNIFFSHIQYEKLHEKSLSMTIHGKDQTKKSVHLGQIGKINLNEINRFDTENRIDFLHEIEKIKPSSVELLISLEKKDDQHIQVDLQRIKGLKIDQKKLGATCYLQILLLDHHRPLTIKQTKFYRLNSSNLILGEKYDFNILTFNSNNLDRLMISFNLYSNSNHTNEYKRIAHIKLASPLFCSGSGTIHWQQFKARESFSMWHTLNKQQH